MLQKALYPMHKKWRFISLWTVTLALTSFALPIASQEMLAALDLPFILSDMLVAFGIGIMLGGVQAALLKPYLSVPHWRSNTAIAAVFGGFFVGGMTIFNQAASAFPLMSNVSLSSALIVISLFQIFMLPKTFRKSGLWVGGHVLLSVFAALNWIPLVGIIAFLMGMWLQLIIIDSKKQKHTAQPLDEEIERLSDAHETPSFQQNTLKQSQSSAQK